MGCGKPCNCVSYRQHVLSVGIAPSAVPSRRGGVHAAQVAATERRWDKDGDAYKRLRSEGHQPPGIDGCAALEAKARHPKEIEMGRTLHPVALDICTEAGIIWEVPVFFEPPVVNDAPTVPASCNYHHHNFDPNHRHHPLACRVRRYYGPNPRGRSVLRIAGTYQTIDTPTQSQIDAASEVYMGGHIYEVDQATADRLVAAGYSLAPPVLSVIVDENGLHLAAESGPVLVTEGAV